MPTENFLMEYEIKEFIRKFVFALMFLKLLIWASR